MPIVAASEISAGSSVSTFFVQGSTSQGCARRLNFAGVSKSHSTSSTSSTSAGRLAMIGLVGCLIGGNGAVPGMDAVALPGAAFTLPFGTFASYH